MFAARGVVVCLAFFAVMYGTLSCLIGSAWWVRQRLGRKQAVSSARVLFGIRIFPFAASSLVAIFFTFPSFWLMECRSLDEDATTFFLAAFALVLLGMGIARAHRAARLTSRAVMQWSSSSSRSSRADTAALSSARGAPALMLVGVSRPKIMLSDMATTLLSANELRVAIRHELGHSRSWDNLKKLLINATPFPGMRGIEQAWREAAELAADDSAVETKQDALDLAAALLKLSRSANQWIEPKLASGLVCGSSAITVRVQRLLDWRTAPRLRRTWPWAVLCVLIVGVVATNYATALVMTHRLTELLVP